MAYRGMIGWGSACLTLGLCTVLAASEGAGRPQGGNVIFKDEPQARALYDQMIEAFRKPQSLSYKSDYSWEAKGRELGHCSYTAWLRKPNQFRIEGASARGDRSATLIGDGQDLWIFWSGDRPHFSSGDQETYDKTRSNAYMTKPAPPGGHSIGHEVVFLGVGMSMPVLDPSMFFGYGDSLQPYVDGVMGMGREKVGDEECDVIEVSIMKHQRSWYLWLSPKDRLPRKLKQVVRVSYDITANEAWSDIVIDGPMAAEKFVWTPPEGWQQWRLPPPEAALLKPGTVAPDFELALADGKKVKLTDFRDRIVWFYIWRAG